MENVNLAYNPAEAISSISSGDKALHSKFSSLFIVESLVFLVFGYYLCHTARHHIKRVRPQAESSALYSKYEVFKNLAVSNFSNLLLKPSPGRFDRLHNHLTEQIQQRHYLLYQLHLPCVSLVAVYLSLLLLYSFPHREVLRDQN
jgi:hypothetical protein